jgi:hypothetical protein
MLSKPEEKLTMRNELVLRKVAEWRHSGGRQTLTVPDAASGWELRLTADRADELGCKVWEMRLGRAVPVTGNDPAALRAWAERAADRVTGLLEPLRLVEVDGQRDEALLRSEQPAQRDEQLYYYEVVLKGRGEADVRRYQASQQPGSRREQVPFALTHEAIAKLTSDLTAAE